MAFYIHVAGSQLIINRVAESEEALKIIDEFPGTDSIVRKNQDRHEEPVDFWDQFDNLVSQQVRDTKGNAEETATGENTIGCQGSDCPAENITGDKRWQTAMLLWIIRMLLGPYD